MKRPEKKNRTEINEYKREWRKKDRVKNPDKTRAYDKKYRDSRKNKQAVMNKVQWAVESGKIIKPTQCDCCGRKALLEGHHQDYSKPLDIMWLCYSCHGFIHRLCTAWEKYLRTSCKISGFVNKNSLPSEEEIRAITTNHLQSALGYLGHIGSTLNKYDKGVITNYISKAISKRIRGEK